MTCAGAGAAPPRAGVGIRGTQGQSAAALCQCRPEARPRARARRCVRGDHAAGRRRHPGDRYLELEFEPHGSAGGRFQQDAVVNYDRRTHSGREVSAHAAIVLMRGDGLPRGSGRGRLAARTAVDTPSCFITR